MDKNKLEARIAKLEKMLNVKNESVDDLLVELKGVVNEIIDATDKLDRLSDMLYNAGQENIASHVSSCSEDVYSSVNSFMRNYLK